ncbi:S9 family peptidase [Shewanella glacialipiscicola]|uniref:Periplasmic peptidase family S9 n=1 Tax=Shewanella glacialipiscicola TaxID=614069 RepID=A0ABQ6J520_9GAMM|nr:prolyl oligopeptidase family serine peptidase [Shewanella glacialipiscicola]MCL1084948.1 prolyl oligopeptidase family serine peptidase [Shewanella glacialipiscicola]GIU13796.1 periplasmic peptidase family S9 [Shewanella glacialipiscicola]GMA82822.1 periplasmic peptidase family S9 [Shewanella glacialipiscicola]
MKLISITSAMLLSIGILPPVLAENSTKPLTLTDIMHFESLGKPVISDKGQVIAVESSPDRGNSHVIVKNILSQLAYQVAGGSDPQVSHDGRYVAVAVKPSLLTLETSDAKAKKKLKSAMVLLDTQTGTQTRFERVQEFTFSDEGKHLAIWFEADDESKKEAESKAIETLVEVGTASIAKPAKPKVDKFDQGRRFTLLSLENQTQQIDIEQVTGYVFDKGNRRLALAVNDIANKQHQLQLVDLNTNKKTVVFDSPSQQVGALALAKNGRWLAFTQGKDSELPHGRRYQLSLVDLSSGKINKTPESPEWKLNRYTHLSFSLDSERLFFGRVPEVSQQLSLQKITEEKDLFDADIVTAQRGLKVWHGDDPRIKPHEIKQYEDEQKRSYLAVLHLGSNNLVQLGDKTVPDVTISQHKRFMLASSDLPYRKMATWAGFYQDYYLVDINTGLKVPFLTQQPSDAEPSLSGNGKYVVYYQQGNVYLYDIEQAQRSNLTRSLKVSFADEDHDYPSSAPGYGFGPWLKDDTGILVYDKYDVWQFNTESKAGFTLTEGKGRAHKIQYRLEGLVDKPDEPTELAYNATILLHGYSDKTKADGFYQARLGEAGIKTLMQGEYKLTVLGRSHDADTIVFSKERFDLFPDLYTASYSAPQNAVKQTDLDKQRQAFNWSQAELVHWTNGDGKPLDGVLIKPTNYQADKRVPVLVYYYRFMTDRLHAFPQMNINHRPNFAWYINNGYAVFLPDIRFEIGYPGASSVQALTSGVQKLIDMGVADPDAIGLQGHSWSGYQTAFAITQTKMFKAAVAGAPVANMTSAYSGIRHGTGVARQFQYETGQSRIGASLFAALQKYIENSPVFYADRIQTPLMIMFGDKDDAVPWEQGVEMYLAMRRAGKDVVFLQYEDEPHHLKKYPNKLDYSIRMMQYFDHYLKGTPAPAWLSKGEAYVEYKTDDE